MRNLISVAVILHVAFTIAGLQLEGKEVEFGDIIVYKPQCKAGIFTYQHYAVFVEDEYPDQGNTFERINKNPACVFSPVQTDRSPYVFNILDGYVDKDGKVYTNGTVAQMKARIEEKRANCGDYHVLKNNCEHLATYVRYGEAISIQFEMFGEKRCKWALGTKRRAMWKFMSLKHRSQNNAASSAFTVAGLELEGKEVEFGDIIVYKPQCKAGIFTYQHYAVFVDDEYPDQGNTFERINQNPACVFSPVQRNRSPYVFNILDGYVDKKGKVYTNGTVAQMKARIEEKRVHCGKYHLLKNNCEHLATYVRYGEKISIQFGMSGDIRCSWAPGTERRAMWKFMTLTHQSQDNAASSIG